MRQIDSSAQVYGENEVKLYLPKKSVSVDRAIDASTQKTSRTYCVKALQTSEPSEGEPVVKEKEQVRLYTDLITLQNTILNQSSNFSLVTAI